MEKTGESESEVSHEATERSASIVRYRREELLCLQDVCGHFQDEWWMQVVASLDPEVVEDLRGIEASPDASFLRRRSTNSERRQRSRAKREALHALSTNALEIVGDGRESEECDSIHEGVPTSSWKRVNEKTGGRRNTGKGSRKHWEDYEEEEEVESFQPPAFSVDGEPDFESGPPQDGWEYLRRVKYEAARCPKVVVAQIDPTKLTSVQTPYIPEIPAIPACPPDLCPSKDWENEFMADFSLLRMALSNICLPPKSESLPSIWNKAGWEIRCFGSVTTVPHEDSKEQDGVTFPDANGMIAESENALNAEVLETENAIKVELGTEYAIEAEELDIANLIKAEELETEDVMKADIGNSIEEFETGNAIKVGEVEMEDATNADEIVTENFIEEELETDYDVIKAEELEIENATKADELGMKNATKVEELEMGNVTKSELEMENVTKAEELETENFIEEELETDYVIKTEELLLLSLDAPQSRHDFLSTKSLAEQDFPDSVIIVNSDGTTAGSLETEFANEFELQTENVIKDVELEKETNAEELETQILMKAEELETEYSVKTEELSLVSLESLQRNDFLPMESLKEQGSDTDSPEGFMDYMDALDSLGPVELEYLQNEVVDQFEYLTIREPEETQDEIEDMEPSFSYPETLEFEDDQLTTSNFMDSLVGLEVFRSGNSFLKEPDDGFSESGDTFELDQSIEEVFAKVFQLNGVSQLPFMQLLLRLDEVSRAALFRHHVTWLENIDGLPQDRALWLLALSAVVDTPLNGETSAAFRALLRQCAGIRVAHRERNCSNCDYHLLNALITVAGSYFGQAESTSS